MYQFYYSEKASLKKPVYHYRVKDIFLVKAVRPTMWEEHCLECAAPVCYGNCSHFQARLDGRCKRFYNGIAVRREALGCSGQAARVKFRRWGNMMTIIFPGMAEPHALKKLNEKNMKLGRHLRTVLHSRLPVDIRWKYIRIREYLRRRKLRVFAADTPEPDAFIFHGYSFENRSFRLMIEIYTESISVFRTSVEVVPGENLHILDKSKLSSECWMPGNLVKIYPENDLEADIEILWADFVQGEFVQKETPADKVKCVVWDLDNTFWDGTLIETEDLNSLQLRPDVLSTVRKLDEKGILQSIASKNDYSEAWPVLERLGVAEYFLYPQIGWGAKSASIRAISEQLNIGIDTFALFDDSAFERNQVNSVLPQVRTYDPGDFGKLLERPEFQVPVTAESRMRREMYRAEKKRSESMKGSKEDTVEFLKHCNLRLRLFVPETYEERLRCFELTVRTNQLNMSGNKYSPQEFEELLRRPGYKAISVSCEDDFGTYGIVGFGQYYKEDNVLTFTEFAMSCRVAGKYVESALFSELLERENCACGKFSVRKTKKNTLLRRTLEEIGFRVVTENSDEINYTFDNKLLNRELVKVEGVQ